MRITKIRVRRINAALDINDVIKKLHISKSTFYKIEQGHLKPSRDLIVKMSNLYECSIEDIFTDLEIN